MHRYTLEKIKDAISRHYGKNIKNAMVDNRDGCPYVAVSFDANSEKTTAEIPPWRCADMLCDRSPYITLDENGLSAFSTYEEYIENHRMLRPAS